MWRYVGLGVRDVGLRVGGRINDHFPQPQAVRVSIYRKAKQGLRKDRMGRA